MPALVWLIIIFFIFRLMRLGVRKTSGEMMEKAVFGKTADDDAVAGMNSCLTIVAVIFAILFILYLQFARQ